MGDLQTAGQDGHAGAGPDDARRLRRFVASAHTNLPDWPATPPEVDAIGRGFILVGLGRDGCAIAERWAIAVATLDRSCLALAAAETPVDAPLLDAFDHALGSAVVGWRLMLAGPPSDVLTLAARARAAGMIDAEIRLFGCDDGMVSLQCAHCRTLFRTAAAPGDERPCPGCALTLVVHQHLSRRLAAFVGFEAS